jgi:hypothetical protein
VALSNMSHPENCPAFWTGNFFVEERVKRDKPFTCEGPKDPLHSYRIREGGAEAVDLGSGTTAPLSEISEDAAKLDALRSRLEAGQP